MVNSASTLASRASISLLDSTISFANSASDFNSTNLIFLVSII